MKSSATWITTLAVLAASPALLATGARGEQARIHVRAGQGSGSVSRYLTGACIEDVNHEIYGGLYSQMIFGESFQEPPGTSPIKGFRDYGGNWRIQGDELHFSGAAGNKLVSDLPAFTNGEVGVEVFMADRRWSNAGPIVRVDRAAAGGDAFDGYEIALNAAGQNVRLGRHRHSWEPIKDTPCEIPVAQWIALRVKLDGREIEVFVNGRSVIRHADEGNALLAGTVGLRQFQSEARYRNLWVKTGDTTRKLVFEPESATPREVSGLWRLVQRGTAAGIWAVEKDRPFVSRQSQRLTFTQGQGRIGVENQGLNRWGLSVVAGKPYEGLLWARAEKHTDLYVALESKDGARVYAEKKLAVEPGDWQRLPFTLEPDAADTAGRFTVTLGNPGSVALGYAFLQPGPWGRFKGLPVRKDIVDGLIRQGITVLRYGGSMVNGTDQYPDRSDAVLTAGLSNQYRWKQMIGPRDRRPPYRGFWYRYSSNGWGIMDFIDLCRAAGFLAVPAFNMGETPQDMADFVQYVNGPADSPWGKRRAADGHPEPYRLRYLQLGNEEAVNDGYWQRFKPLAEAIWAGDPDIILVVGDLVYAQPIKDPSNRLAAHKKILDLAEQHGREVWFDVHIGTDSPRDWQGLLGVPSFIEALGRLNPNAKYKVVVLEFNANSHHMGRALGNARAINELQRIGDRVPIACSANGLQPFRQNDNGWDQGLLFFTPSQVWGQPPYYVTQMFSRNYLPRCVRTEVESPNRSLDATATTDASGRVLQLQVVNLENRPLQTRIVLDGFNPVNPAASVIQLSGALNETNTPDKPERIVPAERPWVHGLSQGAATYTFPPHSFTMILFDWQNDD